MFFPIFVSSNKINHPMGLGLLEDRHPSNLPRFFSTFQKASAFILLVKVNLIKSIEANIHSLV
tara:strand:+ start:2146 stop:2334 length:189 start_codon:yes stop_codon:yes gene_type:complete